MKTFGELKKGDYIYIWNFTNDNLNIKKYKVDYSNILSSRNIEIKFSSENNNYRRIFNKNSSYCYCNYNRFTELFISTGFDDLKQHVSLMLSRVIKNYINIQQKVLKQVNI